MNLVKPVVTVREELTLEEGLFLEQLRELSQTFEPWSSWSSAGELRQEQWMNSLRRVVSYLHEDALRLLHGDLLLNFGATWELTERLLADRVAGRQSVYFNPRGGGCSADGAHAALPDLDWAGLRLAEAGQVVGLVDLDAHGTLLELLPVGADDAALMGVLQEEIAGFEGIDVLIVGASSDSLEADAGGELNFSTSGLEAAGLLLGGLAASTGASVLLVGGTGSLLDSAVPGVWASLFAGLSSSMVFTRAVTGTEGLTTPALDTIDVTG